ncbi:AvrD family protein [Myceligenerans indicum]|uniref:Avirulence D protein (AvrD) n=1 Tax=Myceligenerans indicum TaxID=2593663 RepID=A0ABS1LRE8_9MICO|nr:AvrD family protein [Myceligenerans indicum]MBL0888363.1 hypothetical protein [Myceligenerans indicum]
MTTLTFSSVDDYLGPAEGRFFGAGYRRSELDLSGTAARHDGVTGQLSVTYPQDWSRKKVGVDLRPHLSTVDGLVVAAQLTEALLTLRHGLTPSQRTRMRLVKVTIQAGTEPDEDLGALPVAAELKRTTAQDGSAVSVVNCTVGRMRLRCRVTHPSSPVQETTSARPVPDVLGDPGRRYWGEGYRSGHQSVLNVTADVTNLRATADISTTGIAGDVDLGLGGPPDPVTFIDEFVSALQAFQILLYELDGLSRSESNTLWMQQTTLTYDPDSSQDPGGLSVEVVESDLLELPNGTWRNLTFEAQGGSVRQRSVFAHNLPVNAPALTH